MDLVDKLAAAMEELNADAIGHILDNLDDSERDYNTILKGLNIGIFNVGRRYESGEYFIADLIVSGMIYRDVFNRISMMCGERSSLPVGRVVIGVVEGDIHDIGKDIIVSLLRAEHFEVIDLGVDVKPDRFAYAVQTYRPDVLLLSGVLSIARMSVLNTLQTLKEGDLLKDTPVLIGGLCTTWFEKDSIDASCFAYDSMDTVRFCKEVVKKKYGTEA